MSEDTHATTAGERLAKIETKLGTVERSMDRQTTSLEEINKTLASFTAISRTTDDHETRLRQLESFMWKASGMAAAVGFIAPYLHKLLEKLGG